MVTVSRSASKQGRIEFDNLQSERDHVGRTWKILIAKIRPFLSQDARYGTLPTLLRRLLRMQLPVLITVHMALRSLRGIRPTAVPVPKSALDGRVSNWLALRCCIKSDTHDSISLSASSPVVR